MGKEEKFCHECGEPLKEDAKFCMSCGEKIENSKNIEISEKEISSNADDNSIMKIVGYFLIPITLIWSSIIYSGTNNPTIALLQFIPIAFPFSIAIYFLTLKNSKDRKHGIIMLIILFIILIIMSYNYFYDMTMGMKFNSLYK